jgi:GTP-binding protein
MTFVLVDSRIEPQKIDLEFISGLGENQVPFAIVFTKTDKLGSKQLSANIEVYKKTLLKEWEELPTMIITSSEKKIGRDEVLDLIEKYNSEYR